MATSESDTAFLTLEHSFGYRGQREHWSCVYHFDNVPPSTADWTNLGTAVWNLEKAFLSNQTQMETMYGHTPGKPPVLVWEWDVAPPGEGGDLGTWVPTAGSLKCPGDAAFWMRYGTTQKTSRGKPIYLRNYYHDAHANGDGDTLATDQKAKLDLLGAALVAGISVGGVTYRRAGPRGAVAQNHASSLYVTTRTLKARGRRAKTLPPGSTVQYPPIRITGPVQID